MGTVKDVKVSKMSKIHEPPHAYILYINIIYNYILYINITTKREATRKRPITFFDIFDIFDIFDNLTISF
jgi:hypothetical protein